MQFSATFENHGFGTSTTLSTYQLQGRKTECAEMQLTECSAQSDDLVVPVKCRQLHVHREHQRQRSFQLALKTNVMAPFTTRSTHQLQGRKTQCAEMQLIEYSTQSNDLASPVKCRQLHVQ